MGSAVLARQNESSWVHMGKIPYSNPHLNSNPKSNPKKKHKQFHHNSAPNGVARYHNVNSPVVTQTVSEDAYSFNQISTSRNAVNFGAYSTFNIASYKKSELLLLRKRLSTELDQIRHLRNQIESGQFNVNNVNSNPRSQGKSKKLSENKRPGAPFGSIKDLKRLCNNGFDDGDVVMENAVNLPSLLKECSQILTKLVKHKKGWIFNEPVDAVALGLHDYHRIVKYPMDLSTVKSNLAKSLYPTPLEFAADVRLTFNNALLYNPKADPVHGLAEHLLERFDELFRPILGKMGCNINQAREREMQEVRADDDLQFKVNEELQGSSWNNNKCNKILTSPFRGGKKAKPKLSPVSVPPVLKKPDRMQKPTSMQSHSSASTPSNPPSLPINQQSMMHEQPPSSPVRDPHLPVKELKSGRAGMVKLPKPKAKDPNKREMNMEEKHKLGLGLQSLPQEKMPQLVLIIRKRNEHLAQDGDEIELDIEALDTETLWELDRFVTNWKKLVSKTKRQALMINNNPAAADTAPTTPITDADLGAISDKIDCGKKPKENDDEDVDIDDDMPETTFPPVEIEKDEGGGGSGQGHGRDRSNVSSSSSSSSGSSSDSSSSSDSDSGSSSGSDSDADDAQS